MKAIEHKKSEKQSQNPWSQSDWYGVEGDDGKDL